MSESYEALTERVVGAAIQYLNATSDLNIRDTTYVYGDIPIIVSDWGNDEIRFTAVRFKDFRGYSISEIEEVMPNILGTYEELADAADNYAQQYDIDLNVYSTVGYDRIDVVIVTDSNAALRHATCIDQIDEAADAEFEYQFIVDAMMRAQAGEDIPVGRVTNGEAGVEYLGTFE